MFWKRRRKETDSAAPATRRKRHFLSYKRRWGIWGLVFLLIGVLIAYNYFTQDERVRARLESMLSEVTGGSVHIGQASYSIVGGLKIADVTVDVDNRNLPDSRLLTARKFKIDVNFLKLLHPQRAISAIEAEGVELRLCEDADGESWNFQRLLRPVSNGKPEGPAVPPTPDIRDLPTVHILGASVKYLRTEKALTREIGEVKAEITIFPMPNRQYGFNVAAHAQGKSTRVLGMFDRRQEMLTGKVSELDFDHSLRRMLPRKVGRWFDDLDFSGQFSIPRFEYRFPAKDRKEAFDITLAFDKTRATIQPRMWLTQNEQQRKGLMEESIRIFEMLGMNRPMPRRSVGSEDEDVEPLKVTDYLRLHLRSIPVRWSDVSGRIRFTQDEIDIDRVSYRVQDQAFEMSGRLQGYDVDAPATLSLRTAPGTFLKVPPTRQFMAWLPEAVRKTYMQFKPLGKAQLDVQLTREVAGGPFDPVVIVDLSDAQIEFEDFPYPLQHCNGRFVFSHDAKSGEDLLRIHKLIGNGIPDGPNVNSTVEVNGIIGPFIKGGPGVDVTVKGTNIFSEPKIRQTFPKEVAAAMKLFGPPDYGKRQADSGVRKLELPQEESFLWPQFHGDFLARIRRAAGPFRGVDTTVDMTLDRATGCLKSFPYPMHDLSCVLHINDDRLVIENLRMNRGDARLKLDGKVTFADPTSVDISVEALNVPIDDALLNSLPPSERSWIRRGGLGGHVDIVGRIFIPEDLPGTSPDVDFDLNLRLIDATLLKDASGPAITGANGEMFLEPARLQIKHLEGKRAASSIKASGLIDWQDGTPDVALKISADNLLLDKALHDMLPAGAQASWDEQKPEGTTDLDLDYTLFTPPAPAATSQGSAADSAVAGSEKIKLDLRPRQLSATPAVFPYRLDNLKGRILVDDKHVQLIGLSADHGKAHVKIDADGVTGEKSDFRLKVLATGLTIENELMLAMPEAVADVIDSLETEGEFMVRFDDLRIRTSPTTKSRPATTTPSDARAKRLAQASTRAATGPASSPLAAASLPATAATTRHAVAQDVDVDFNCVITGMDAKMNVGFPVSGISGWAQLIGQVRNSELVEMDGTVSADRYEVLGRKGAMLTATLKRPRNFQGMLVQSLRSDLAGGSASADVTLLTPADGPSQYAVEVTVQNAQMSQVAGDALKQPLNATISASFDAEGVINQNETRQGRGRIEIRGQGMYEAPIVLGFFRLVNFAMPLREGVNEVDMSYTLMGDRAVFDSVEMRAPGLRIYGDGLMDFGTRKLNFTLNTENPNAIKIPLLKQIVQRAKEELLQIHVGGTISEPQVGTRTFPTFQATLDQVLEDVKRRPAKEK